MVALMLCLMFLVNASLPIRLSGYVWISIPSRTELQKVCLLTDVQCGCDVVGANKKKLKPVEK